MQLIFMNDQWKGNSMKAFQYKIQDEIGIHARPAGLLVKEAKQYKSKITLKINDKEAEATKLMAVMSLGVKNGQTVEVMVVGEDEEVAAARMQTFFEQNL